MGCSTAKIPIAQRKIIILFFQEPGLSLMSPAHIKSNENMEQMVLNLLICRGQTLARYVDLKGYLITLALNIPISARHSKMLTGIAPKGCSIE